MLRILIPIAIAVPLLVLGQNARGQTPVPTGTPTAPLPSPVPTVTATPIPTQNPAYTKPETLLNKMDAAFKSKKTYHSTSVTTSEDIPPTSRQVDKGTTDEIYNKPASHSFDSITSTDLTSSFRPSTERDESIVVKDVGAYRTNNGDWKCLSLKDVSGLAGTIGQAFANAKFSYETVGPAKVKGMAAWHVRITMDIPGFTTPGQPALDDVYLAKSNFTELHEEVSMSFTITIEGETISGTSTGTADFSKYGEGLTIKLPSACKTASALSSDSWHLPPAAAHLLGFVQSTALRALTTSARRQLAR